MSLIFNLIDSIGNALTGSKVGITAYSGPYISGSYLTYNGSVVGFTDTTGSLSLPMPVPGVYKVSISGPGANNPATYINNGNEIFYINIPTTASFASGSQQNVENYIITGVQNTGNSASFAWSIQASDARYLQLTQTASWAQNSVSASYFSGSISNAVNAISSSYALTASFALNGGGTGGNNLTASYLTPILHGQYINTNGAGAITIGTTNGLSIDNTGNVVSLFDNSANGVFINNASSGSGVNVQNSSAASNILLAKGGNVKITDGLGNVLNMTSSGVIVTGNLSATGSLFGTASYSKNAISTSFTITSSFLNGSQAQLITDGGAVFTDGSGDLKAVSYLSPDRVVIDSLSNFNGKDGTFTTIHCNAITGSINTASYAKFAANGTQLNDGNNNIVSVGSAAVNITDTFGDTINMSNGLMNIGDGQPDLIIIGGDVLQISASSAFNGQTLIPNLTASLFGTASWAKNAVTASFFSGSISNAVTASYALTALTASFFSGSISNAVSSSYALTASFALNAGGGSGGTTLTTGSTYQITSSWANNSVTASGISGIIPIANGGTSANNARAASNNIGILNASPLGGGQDIVDILTVSPAYEGQIGTTYNNSKAPNLFAAGSTNSGDWIHGFYFPTYVVQIGDADFSDPNLCNQNLVINQNGSPNTWNAFGDTTVVVRNFSQNSGSSGGGIVIELMGTGSGIITASISNTGSGYVINDFLTPVGGTVSANGNGAFIKVLSVNVHGGIVTSIMGSYGEYVTPPANVFSASGGSGTGATFTLVTQSRGVSISNDSCAWVHAPQNRVAGLIPGWSYMVFNTDPVNMKGYAVCGPGIANNGDLGNQSIAMFDLQNKMFRIPRWITGSYQPTDPNYLDSFTVQAKTGDITHYGTASFNNIIFSSGSIGRFPLTSISGSILGSTLDINSNIAINATIASNQFKSNVSGIGTSSLVFPDNSGYGSSTGELKFYAGSNTTIGTWGSARLRFDQNADVYWLNDGGGNIGLSGSARPGNVYVQHMVSSSTVVAQSVTASLLGTSSFAVSASWAPSSGGSGTTLTTGSTYQITSSWANNSISSSYINGVTGIINNLTCSQLLLTTSSSFAGELYSTTNSFAEVNIQNFSSGNSSSADLVATNNSGSENTYYVNVGINGSQYSQGFIGQSNDSYLYNTGSNLYIGNVTANKNVYLFAGGFTNTSSLTLTSTGKLGVGTIVPVNSLDVIGNISCSIITASLNGIHSGSVFGTASWANNSVTSSFALSSNATTLTTGSTYQITSSWSVNAITASFVNYNTTTSLAPLSANNYSVSLDNRTYSITSSTDLNFASSSFASAERFNKIFISPATASRAITVNSNWKWVGNIVPTTLNSGSFGILSFDCIGSTESNIFGAWVTNGSSSVSNAVSSSYATTASFCNNIQAGSSSLSTATTAVFTFAKPFANTNYAISLTSNAAITSLAWNGKTTTGFSSSMGIFTGIIDWIAIPYSQ